MAWTSHSELLRELWEDDVVEGDKRELPRGIDDALQAVLDKLAVHADGHLAWRAVCHVLQTKSIRPHLFGGLTDAQLDALEETMDYYGMPKTWCVWVQQERAARDVHGISLLHLMWGRPSAQPWMSLSQLLSDAVAHIYRYDILNEYNSTQQVEAALIRVMAEMEVHPTPAAADVHPTHTEVADYYLRVLVGHRPSAMRSQVCPVLAACGDLEGLRHAHEHGAHWGWTCRVAALAGHLECLQLAHENGACWDEQTCHAAVGSDEHVVYWRYAYVRQGPGSPGASKRALECLRYARENGCRWNMEIMCKVAAAGGALDCLRYAREHGCDWDAETCATAAANGELECLRYLHENGCAWDKDTCRMAAREGWIECLRYAHQHGCAWDWETCAAASMGDSVECLRYAHEHGCEWNKYVCDNAAAANSLACLRYAHENGCPWDEETCKAAAWRCSLECLEYAHQNGCAWDARTRENAMDFFNTTNPRQSAFLRYLDEHQCPPRRMDQ